MNWDRIEGDWKQVSARSKSGGAGLPMTILLWRTASESSSRAESSIVMASGSIR